jgi:hypothetical protein
MNVRMIAAFNFPAAQAFVTAINSGAIGFNRILAVQSFCQSAGERFQMLQRIAGKQIGVAEPSTGKRALQQLNALRLFFKSFEAHGSWIWRGAFSSWRNARSTVWDCH